MCPTMRFSRASRLSGSIRGVLPGAAKIFGRKCLQDAGHRLAGQFDDLEFFLEVAIVVGEAGGEEVGIPAGQQRIVFSDDPFHASRVHGLEIGEVTDDFEDRPLAGNRAGDQLVAGEAGHGVPKELRVGFVLGNELLHGWFRAVCSWFGVLGRVSEIHGEGRRGASWLLFRILNIASGRASLRSGGHVAEWPHVANPHRGTEDIAASWFALDAVTWTA